MKFQLLAMAVAFAAGAIANSAPGTSPALEARADQAELDIAKQLGVETSQLIPFCTSKSKQCCAVNAIKKRAEAAPATLCDFCIKYGYIQCSCNVGDVRPECICQEGDPRRHCVRNKGGNYPNGGYSGPPPPSYGGGGYGGGRPPYNPPRPYNG